MFVRVLPIFSPTQLANAEALATTFETGALGEKAEVGLAIYVACLGQIGVSHAEISKLDSPQKLVEWVREHKDLAKGAFFLLQPQTWPGISRFSERIRRREEARPAIIEAGSSGLAPKGGISKGEVSPIGYSAPSFLVRFQRLYREGEVEEIRDFISEVVDRAKEGDEEALQNLKELASLNHPDIASWAKEAFERLEMSDLLLRLAVPEHEGTHQVSFAFKVALLKRPPRIGASKVVLERILNRPGLDGEQGEQLKNAAAEGLFYLTSLAGAYHLSVEVYWNTLWSSHVNSFPPIDSSLFKAKEGRSARWDLFQKHVEEAFHLAEMSEDKYYAAPFHLRRAALWAVWKDFGAAERPPEDIRRDIYQRTLKIAEKSPNLGWPLLAHYYPTLVTSMGENSDFLLVLLLKRMEKWEEGNLNEKTQRTLVEAVLALSSTPFVALLPDSEATPTGRLWHAVLSRDPELRDFYRRLVVTKKIQNRFSLLQDFYEMRDRLFFVRSEEKRIKEAKAVWPTRMNVPQFLEMLRELGRYGVTLDEETTKKTVKGFLESVVLSPHLSIRIYSREVEDFRRYIYALNPAATVTAWHEWTAFLDIVG